MNYVNYRESITLLNTQNSTNTIRNFIPIKLIDLTRIPIIESEEKKNIQTIGFVFTITGQEFKLPLINPENNPILGYNFTVNWGDGNVNTITSWDDQETTHIYSLSENGTYTITITGQCWGWRFANNSDANKIIDISSWGENFRLGTDQGNYFEGCVNLNISDTNPLDLSGTTSLEACFKGCTNLNSDNLIGWQVENITNMSSLFEGCSLFNKNISGWNVSNVINMSNMFAEAISFKQDLSNWNPVSASNMTDIFRGIDINNTGTTTNYDNLLNNWSNKLLQSNINFNGGSSKHSYDSFAGKYSLETFKTWEIYDGGTNTTFNFYFNLINTTIPNYSYVGEIKFSNGLNVLSIILPANSDINFESSTSSNQISLNTLQNRSYFLYSNYNSIFTNINNLSSINILINITDLSDSKDYLVNQIVQLGIPNIPNNLTLNYNYNVSINPVSVEFMIDTENVPSGLILMDNNNNNNNNNNKYAGSSSSNPYQFALPLTNTGNYNFIVLWGDGQTSTFIGYDPSGNDNIHTYQESGVKFIKIFGTLNGFSFNNSGDCLKLIDITEITSDFKLGNEGGYFYGCVNLNISATNPIDLTGTTNLENCFRNCSQLDSLSLVSWDVSNITNFRNMFNGANSFDQDISVWNMSNAISIIDMFQGATSFSQNIGNWTLPFVTDYSNMFKDSINFNEDISNWNVSNVTNMSGMFSGSFSFKQNLSSWNVGKLLDASNMFSGIDINNAGTTTNYDSLINSWYPQIINNLNVLFDGGNSKFSYNSIENRYNLENIKNWTITDGGTDFIYEFIYNFDRTLNCIYTISGTITISDGSSNLIINLPTDIDFENVKLAQNLYIQSKYGNGYDIYSTNKNILTNPNSILTSNIIITDCNNNQYLLINNTQIGNPSISSNGLLVNYSYNVDLEYSFEFTVNTENVSDGSSENNQFKLPLIESYEYNFWIDWGDGSTIENIINWNTTKTYNSIGIYVIKIYGTLNGFSFNNTGDRLKITDISYFGSGFTLGNTGGYFYGCSNLNISATTPINLNGTTNLENCFRECSNFNSSNISNWDVSGVNNMTLMFASASSFNQPIQNWNVGNVTNMSSMFAGALNFNQPIQNWNVGNVLDMSNMFGAALNFNQSLFSWNVGKVTNMSYMFESAISFNQPIQYWNTENVTDMKGMFQSAFSFNQNLSWNTSKVKNMSNMFASATSFNQELIFDTFSVTNMSSMFAGANSFIGNGIGSWNVINVTDMSYMFYGASLFDKDLSFFNTINVSNMSNMFAFATSFNNSGNNLFTFNTSNVTDMSYMFNGATSFNKNIDDFWNVSNVTNMSNMFNGATSFKQSLAGFNVINLVDATDMFLGIDINESGNTNNYDSTIYNWCIKLLKQNVPFHAGLSKFSIEGLFAKYTLENTYNWIITDAGTDFIYEFNVNFDTVLNCDTYIESGTILITDGSSNLTINLPLSLSDINFESVKTNDSLIIISKVGRGYDIYSSNYDVLTNENSTVSINILVNDCNGNQYVMTGNLILGNPFISQDRLLASYIFNTTSNLLEYSLGFTINTENLSTGSTPTKQFKLPLIPSGEYNFSVDWGDSTSLQYVNTNNYINTSTKTYTNTGIYNINIYGFLNGFSFNNSGDRLKLTNISYFGTDFKLGNIGGYFYGCENLDISSNNTPNLSGTSTFDNCFRNCTNFNSVNVSTWDVSGATTMDSMFEGCSVFNRSLSTWNTSNVRFMSSMFKNCSIFNQSLTTSGNSWNVEKVEFMNSMFENCIAFKQNISSWNPILCISMTNMFSGANMNTAGTTTNYDALLNAWSGKSLLSNVIFSAGNSQYSFGAQTARYALLNKSWSITDNDLNVAYPVKSCNAQCFAGVLYSDGRIKMQGKNGSGMLGQGNTIDSLNSAVWVLNITNAVDFAIGTSDAGNTKLAGHCVAVLADGTAWGWGDDSNGQAGTSTGAIRSTPGKINGISNCKSVICGERATLFLLNDGTMRSIGTNTYGILGNGDTNKTTNNFTVQTVVGLNNVVKISAGNYHAMALLADGTIRTWGLNDNGQIIDGSQGASTVYVSPYQPTSSVLSLGTIVDIECGGWYNLICINVNGNRVVYANGRNNHGQLGVGTLSTTPPYVIPLTQVQNVNNCIEMTGEWASSLFLSSDGTLRVTGQNTYYQQGNPALPTSSRNLSPVVLSGGFVGPIYYLGKCSGAPMHTLIAGNICYSWGSNSAFNAVRTGQLGIGGLSGNFGTSPAQSTNFNPYTFT
jgi:surface protein